MFAITPSRSQRFLIVGSAFLSILRLISPASAQEEPSESVPRPGVKERAKEFTKLMGEGREKSNALRHFVPAVEACVKGVYPDVLSVYVEDNRGMRAALTGTKSQVIDLETGTVVYHEGFGSIGMRGGNEVMSAVGFEALHPKAKAKVGAAVDCYHKHVKLPPQDKTP